MASVELTQKTFVSRISFRTSQKPEIGNLMAEAK